MLIHGGDVAGYQLEYGTQPLDFSANVSPLGLPPEVRAAAIGALDRADAYPDPLCRALSQAIAHHEGVTPAQVLCGNGAADLIFRLVTAFSPKTALLPAPTFAEYGQALEQGGCQIRRHILQEDEGFQITPRILREITDDLDVIFLCQPNNPTGVLCEQGLLEAILERCRQTGTLLVLDECFTEFLDRPQDHSLRHRLSCPQLLILKAFTKVYAMAGLRLGYCLSANASLLTAMQAAGQPWSVSCVAQEAGIAALSQTDYVRRLKTLLAKERPALTQGLAALGLCVYPPAANYIFFSGPPGLDRALRPKGILIRPCENYPGLDGRFYRVAIRTQGENQQLLHAIKEVLPWRNPL